MKKFLQKMVRTAKSGFSSVKAKTLAVLGITGLAVASATAADYTIVEKGSDGGIEFMPQNLATPIIDALIQSYAAWAVVFLVIIGVGIIIWVMRKK